VLHGRDISASSQTVCISSSSGLLHRTLSLTGSGLCHSGSLTKEFWSVFASYHLQVQSRMPLACQPHYEHDSHMGDWQPATVELLGLSTVHQRLNLAR
jgi:hypothetical protein